MQWTPRHYPLLKAIAHDGHCDGEWESSALKEMQSHGAVRRGEGRWELLEDGWRTLWLYTRMLEKDPVLHELAALHRYATGARDAALRYPDRPEMVTSVRAYLSGALTTLRHLDLVASKEHQDWCRWIEGTLPPPENTITVKAPKGET